jgi:hypothetical protein
MRQIDDYFDTIPESLLPSTLVANGTLYRILTSKRIESSDYNKPDVKLRLLQIYAYCCAYCEARVSNYDPIDHFRAKNAIIRKIQERFPFSAVRRACLVNFKFFFIDKFTGEDEIRLNNAYQRLKDNLTTIQ